MTHWTLYWFFVAGMIVGLFEPHGWWAVAIGFIAMSVCQYVAGRASQRR